MAVASTTHHLSGTTVEREAGIPLVLVGIQIDNVCYCSAPNLDHDEVIVVDTGDTVEEAIWGELLATYATRIGVRGLVTNGAVRDVDGIRELAFPVFAQSVTPRGPSGRMEAERNVEVTVGGA